MSNASTPRTKTPPDLKKYYTPAEVEAHNAPYDLWLSWYGNVYDLSVLADERKGDPLLAPILKNAGRDISHWFTKTGDLKSCVNPLTGSIIGYTPEGRFLHVPPPLPRADWDVYGVRTPWWLDKEQYCIGKLGSRTRKIIIKNTLTQDEHIVEVCIEEKLSAIQDRFLSLNAHAKGYMWKRLGQLLDMTASLDENGIKDEGPLMEKLGMDEEQYLPTIHLYFRLPKMFILRSSQTVSLVALRRFSARSFSAAAVARTEKPHGSDSDPYNLPIPGFRAPGQIPHNWEVATGNERYEYVKRLQGEEPWEDMQPYVLTSKPTAKNPFIVRGSDPEKYLGCTGFPADTHETVWLTLRSHRGVDRCPHCGNAYKYEQADAHH